MLSLGGCEHLELIHRSDRHTIYRGIKNSLPVILKILNKEYPSQKELNDFASEYHILQSLASHRIVKAISLEKIENTLGIIFADIGGKALYKTSVLQYSLSQKIELFIKAVEGLQTIHDAELMHRDIKIHNIILNEETGDLQIIDFGSASRLTKQNTFISLHQSVEGTLAYISPEQTGRMNRTVDYRTDFYSLGITFYQIFTGKVPFFFPDPLELIHAHIAKTPIPPVDISNIPSSISNIILKLMEKDPNDRYQSAQGILKDLIKCRVYFEKYGLDGLNKFQLKVAEEDFSSRFQIPQKLYGREKEIQSIQSMFKSITKGASGLLFVSGVSGIGKTSLVSEIRKSVTESRGYYLTGKFDLLKRSIPYRAISQAFQSLVQQILTEGEASIQRWKLSLQNALGHNAKLLVDMVPDLASLLGEIPEMVSLSAEEAENRFHEAFQNFLDCLCKNEHPLVIFLDDLQWADLPSLQLIETIFLHSDRQHLFLILAYRSSEVVQGDAFSQTLERLKRIQKNHQEIFLFPIEKPDVYNLVKETLSCDPNTAGQLAEDLFHKTKGNPFFINAVFQGYYDKDLIKFRQNVWQLDLNKIKAEQIAENVIDFMVDKVKELPENLSQVLKFAACVGNWFRTEVFIHIYNQPRDIVTETLIQLSNEGFLNQTDFEVNFIHDKIREATYSLIPEKTRSLYHYQIANGYISLLHQYKLDDYIFTIVNQLNQGIAYLRTEEEFQRHIDYNLLAGKKALSSLAAEAAADFLKMAIRSLSPNSWQSDYERTLNIYSYLARAEYLSKNFEEAERIFNLILENSKTAEDQSVVYELKSSIYVSQNKMDEALSILKKAVGRLGIRLPAKPSEISPLPEIIKFKVKFGKRKIESLYDAPLLEEKKSNLILHLLNSAIAPSFIGQPALFPVIVLKMVNLSIRKGNSPLSAFAYSLFGIIQGSGLGDFNAGFAFGQLALRLLNRFKEEAKAVECKIRFIYANMISPWKRHAKEGESEFLKSISSGRESGDLQYTSYAINNLHFQKILMRQNLLEIKESFQKYDKLFQNLKQYNAYQLYQLNQQFIENLSGTIEDKVSLIGTYFDERVVLPEWIESKNANALFDFYLTKSRLEFLFGDARKALEYSWLADPYESAMLGMMFVPEHVFFQTLIIAECHEQSSIKDKKALLKRVAKNIKRLAKWSESCSENYAHKYFISLALQSWLLGKKEEAIARFKKAISLARLHGYLFEEAIANEWLAKYWLWKGEEPYAKYHLQEAKYAYETWGAVNKASQLVSEHSFLKQSSYLPKDLSQKIDPKHSISPIHSTSSHQFDLISVIKASQAISSEIQLDKLLETMMRILLENAGAESGLFILNRAEGFRIEAIGNFNRDEILTSQGIPLTDADKYPIHLINYVIRSKSVLLLNNALAEGVFVNDPYILSHQSKSILCYPIINHGILTGIIYLENNLLTSAFTEDQIEVLKVLSAQIGMSVENSLLFSNLEEKVEERTKNLNDALIAVSSLKEQQDMDYFLNTLLVEPLGVNHAHSKLVEVEFFLRQKKTFQFRGKDYELGGDINISDNLKLAGKSYTVFLNGDAMGKSVQGAGGVLVIGTIFKSIIQRTNSTDYGADLYPERWIKNAYYEMQKAFESFDGTMLMSTIFGLLDEEMGTLYFMNVSHPDLVLFRSGAAHYVRRSNELPKLGHDDPTLSVSLNVISLQNDDIILIGSDGKDDLIIGTDDAGYDIFNDDETLFLNHVEASKADLEQIYELVGKSGMIIDDLSLLKIKWLGKKDTIPESIHLETLQEIQALKVRKDFTSALELARGTHELYPDRNEYLLEISQIYAEEGEYKLAIDFGEKLRLREPKDTTNILNLVKCYLQIGKKNRAKEILHLALQALGQDPKLKEASELLT
ncbi:kinase domain protein [Leptospira ryugenii]|uniref:Kinase domain protein n=1 Tax=Leptospira ryugenii TaxID=1917863 RepID=A0A2P2E580_9LEPT|nr:AAA family ATPase [Leptospira ryugenii]GBF52036.1 kinase domain protein [Leptospira ryugenii]